MTLYFWLWQQLQAAGMARDDRHAHIMQQINGNETDRQVEIAIERFGLAHSL